MNKLLFEKETNSKEVSEAKKEKEKSIEQNISNLPIKLGSFIIRRRNFIIENTKNDSRHKKGKEESTYSNILNNTQEKKSKTLNRNLTKEEQKKSQIKDKKKEEEKSRINYINFNREKSKSIYPKKINKDLGKSSTSNSRSIRCKSVDIINKTNSNSVPKKLQAHKNLKSKNIVQKNWCKKSENRIFEVQKITNSLTIQATDQKLESYLPENEPKKSLTVSNVQTYPKTNNLTSSEFIEEIKDRILQGPKKNKSRERQNIKNKSSEITNSKNLANKNKPLINKMIKKTTNEVQKNQLGKSQEINVFNLPLNILIIEKNEESQLSNSEAEILSRSPKKSSVESKQKTINRDSFEALKTQKTSLLNKNSFPEVQGFEYRAKSPQFDPLISHFQHLPIRETRLNNFRGTFGIFPPELNNASNEINNIKHAKTPIASLQQSEKSILLQTAQFQKYDFSEFQSFNKETPKKMGLSKRSSEFVFWNQLDLSQTEDRNHLEESKRCLNKSEDEEEEKRMIQLYKGDLGQDEQYLLSEKSMKNVKPSLARKWFRNDLNSETRSVDDNLDMKNGNLELASCLAMEEENIQALDSSVTGFYERLNMVQYATLNRIKEGEKDLPPFQLSKVIKGDKGLVKYVGLNTHKGVVRPQNEDTISVLLNCGNQLVMKPKSENGEVHISMFSLFDGHGGSSCSDFLKSNFNQVFLEQFNVQGNLLGSVKSIFKKLDSDYLFEAVKKGHYLSGSCVVSLIVVDESLVILNLGDSRCIASKNNGKESQEITRDHKPDSLVECSRILEGGGELRRVATNLETNESSFYVAHTYPEVRRINELERREVGCASFSPWRINPGGLSISRSIGDVSAKKVEMGGIENLVIAEPDIYEFPVEDIDFLVLACWLISRWRV